MFNVATPEAANCAWRIVYNNDGSSHVFSHPFPMSYAQLIANIAPLAGVVDTFVYQMFSGNVFLHDTKVGEFYTGERCQNAAQNARHLIDQGLDPMQVLCDGAHEKGIKFFAGLRINDLHDLWFEDLICGMKLAHPEMLIGDKGRAPQPASTDWDSWDPEPRRMAWNFADSRVVAMRMALLQETVENYDIDGLEIDFLRYPLFFPPGEEAQYAHIITELVRATRKMLDKKGQAVGRPLELGLIVPYSPQVCEEVGMEIHDWLADGLLDYIAPRATDLFLTETPFEDWKPLLAGCGTQLLGATFTCGKFEDDIYYALASRCRQVGTDGMHLFNFNYWRPPTSQESTDLLKGLGDPAAIALHNKHYILACRKHTTGSYVDRFDVPCYLEDEARITFFLGDDLTETPTRPLPRRVTIQLYTQGYDSAADEVAFVVNGQEIASPRIHHYDEEKDLTEIGCWWTKPQQVTVTDMDVTSMSLYTGENQFIAKLLKAHVEGPRYIVIRHFGVYVNY